MLRLVILTTLLASANSDNPENHRVNRISRIYKDEFVKTLPEVRLTYIADGTAGMYDHNVIYLSDRLNEDQLFDTLNHEIGHFIFDKLDYDVQYAIAGEFFDYSYPANYGEAEPQMDCFVTEYAATEFHEDFAETIRAIAVAGLVYQPIDPPWAAVAKMVIVCEAVSHHFHNCRKQIADAYM